MGGRKRFVKLSSSVLHYMLQRKPYTKVRIRALHCGEFGPLFTPGGHETLTSIRQCSQSGNQIRGDLGTCPNTKIVTSVLTWPQQQLDRCA